MNIYAIGDLHLSGNPPKKPMHVFGTHWEHHWDRIRAHWSATVQPDDIVFLVGDMSWALRLDEAAYDLKEIAALPGRKFMIRGNHDYWWASVKKMKALMGDSITFLQGHGTALTVDTAGGPRIVAFGGTRGYLCPGDSNFMPQTDLSIYNREIMRTEAALSEMETAIARLRSEGDHISAGALSTGSEELRDLPVTRILLLHYPPFNDTNEPSDFTKLMENYRVDTCIFGHLHDAVSFQRIPETFGSTKLALVSADYMNFTLHTVL